MRYRVARRTWSGHRPCRHHLSNNRFHARRRVENGVTCGWAPDGRHFITATTAPRLRVDNALCVYKYNGLLLHKREFFMLLDATWVPAPAGDFLRTSRDRLLAVLQRNFAS